MKRNSLQFLPPSFQRVFLPFLIVALALSLLSVSQLTQPTREQGGQKISTSPAPGGSSGSGIVYPATRKGDTIDDYFGTKVPDPYRWHEGDADVDSEVASW